MKRIIFESAPEFILLCIVLGLAYAAVQYFKNKQHPWGNTLNWLLFSFRAIVVTFLAFLLLGPIVKQINNLFEKPLFVVLYDNSASVKETTDSISLKSVERKITETRDLLENKGYEASLQTLKGDDITSTIKFNATTSDLNSALKRIGSRYEGRNVAGVVLVSDGIYNAGLSPLYSSYNFPIHT
jgi:hypothetical protein